MQIRFVCARWVPRNLTEQQLERQVQVCKNTVQMSETIPNFLTSTVTCDETWIHHYDPLSKQQSSVWKHSNSPPPKKFRSCLSAGKVKLLLFFDEHGMIFTSLGSPWADSERRLLCKSPENALARSHEEEKTGFDQETVVLFSRIMPGHILLLCHWQQ